MGKILRQGENGGNTLEKRRSTQPVASQHGVGRYPGSLLSTQPLAGVSSSTRDTLPPAFDKQDMHNH